MRLFLILMIVPIIEIALFIQVGGLIGVWPTIAIVILTALAGSYLLRQQGLQALRDVQTRISAGDSPGQLLAEGAMILFSGALLLTPGFFTDALGLALLVPQVRAGLYRRLKGHVRVVHAGPSTQARRDTVPPADQVVEGEYVDVTPETGPRQDPDHRSGG